MTRRRRRRSKGSRAAAPSSTAPLPSSSAEPEEPAARPETACERPRTAAPPAKEGPKIGEPSAPEGKPGPAGPEDPDRCRTCGAEIVAGGAFCPECGRSADDDGEHAAADEPGLAAPLDTEAVAQMLESLPFGHERAPEGVRLTRKERRAQLKRIKAEKAEVKKRKRAASASQTASIQRQLKERDKQLQDRHKKAKRERAGSEGMFGFLNYEALYRDGIAMVFAPDAKRIGLFSETVEFDDVSYQTAPIAKQEEVYGRVCTLLEGFGSNATVQFTVFNEPMGEAEAGMEYYAEDSQPEELRSYAAEMNEVINRQKREGASNIRRRRFVTYACGSYSVAEGIRRVASMRLSATGNIELMKSHTRVLDGNARLALMSAILRPHRPFDFDYDRDLSFTEGLTTKDFIAPMDIDFKPSGRAVDDTFFRMDGTVYGQVLVVRKIGARLTDKAVSCIADLPIPLVVTWYLQGWDQSKSLAFANRYMTMIDAEIINEQQSAVRRNYDGNIISHNLDRSKREAAKVLDKLENKSERLFEYTGLVYTFADTAEELTQQVVSIIEAGRSQGLEIDVLPKRQRQGLSSILPLGANSVEVSRLLTTGQAAMGSIPFATSESYMEPGCDYIGVNKVSGCPVGYRRIDQDNASGLVSGMPRTGKSYWIKQYMMSKIMSTTPREAAELPRDCEECGWTGVTPEDLCPACGHGLPEPMTAQIIVVDPAGEYEPLVEAARGACLRFEAGTTHHNNIMDTRAVSDMPPEQVMAQKISALTAFAASLAFEAGAALSEEERSVLSRCVQLTYDAARAEGRVPVLGDLYDSFLEQPEPEAKRMALRFERFVKGANGFLNHESNIDWNRRVVDLSIRNLSEDVRCPVLIAQLEAVRNRVFHNFEHGIETHLIIDELQTLLRHPSIVEYLARFWSELPKFNLIPTGIVQNASLLKEMPEAKTIVNNSDFVMLFKQSTDDQRAWKYLKDLSDAEAEYINDLTPAGHGLLIAGPLRIPIKGAWPSGPLYDLLTTKASEVAQRKLNERFAAARERMAV